MTLRNQIAEKLYVYGAPIEMSVPELADAILALVKKEYKEIYKQGFIDGLTCYAWWGKDGQEVGTGGTKLKDAVAKVEKNWNYQASTLCVRG